MAATRLIVIGGDAASMRQHQMCGGQLVLKKD